ncbi:phosphate butyryltransferase [Salirhabdus euzebyi]|uniref:Phosphate butyryltransferase n=1 Tax=Salirhabdus euzebyi TaxID=394506 RepID=A0A841Q723_9BACI|nr:phosphate butyryltransferase [Salirhabdus euzebyi]MBB6454206.1 phosphate butyryltransferase [Salirhabdus euzebyi]
MNLTSLLDKLKENSHQKVVAVAQAADKEVLKAIKNAIEHGIAKFMLFGDVQEIRELASNIGLDVNNKHIKIVHAKSDQNAAEQAVKKVHFGEAHVVMKGKVPTKVLLKEILHKDYGLRTGKVLSHVAVFDVPNQDRLLILTDAGMNVNPDLEQKAQITQNAVEVAHKIGIDNPKVAALSAVEVVNPSMQATLDGAALTQMQKRGQIKGCIVDGPLAFDNAISLEAAKEKGIHSEVAGKADILLVPTIETGNALYKSFIYFANAKVAAVISGAAAPIVLTSRSDSFESKLYSLVLALLTAKKDSEEEI